MRTQWIQTNPSDMSVEKVKKLQTPGFRFNVHLRTCALLLFLGPIAAKAQAPDTLMAVRDENQTTRMSLHKNGSLYVGGNYDGGIYSGGIPVEGAGTRLMWYPEKASFRAGRISGTQWDDANIGYHSVAIGEDARASGDHGVAFGRLCTAAGSSTFAVGDQNVASGAASVALGYHAHTNARQGSFVFSDRSSIDTLRAGVNHSANWRTSGGFRIFTSSNLSTGVTLQSGASVSNWGQSNAVISTSTGAYLSTSGVWTNVSDVNRKHLFKSVSGEDILNKLRNIPIQQWSYLTDDDKVRHVGPTAQDFHAAFGLGNDERTIGTIDADGIALAGVQALEARTSKQAAEVDSLKAENAALHARLDALEKRTGMSSANVPLTASLLLGGIGLGGFLLRRRNAGGTKA